MTDAPPQNVQPRSYDFVKRFIDVVGAAALLVICNPLLLLNAILIALESGVPVVCRQERVGRGGHRFAMLKLRTVRANVEGDGTRHRARIDDMRGTRVGQFMRRAWIDELPQLINVLQGEMSFVGPEPERLDLDETFSREIPGYSIRYAVRPGVTGWAQVKLAHAPIGSRLRLEYDLYYVKHRSLGLDLRIIATAIGRSFWPRNSV